VIAPPTTGKRPHRIWLQKPGPLVPTDDGGYEQSWLDLSPPKMFAEIEPASAVDLQRIFSDGAIISAASHVVTFPFHRDVNTKTRIMFDGRTFTVGGFASPDERHASTVCACMEVVQ
jgi:head-tail adaptor